MLAAQDKLVIERFKTLMLERGVPLYSVVVFGSRARGHHEPGSDDDVLVVVVRLDRTI